MKTIIYNWLNDKPIGPEVDLPFLPVVGMRLVHEDAVWKVELVQAIIPREGSRAKAAGELAIIEVLVMESTNIRWTENGTVE
jgi:hypothetical protein